MRLPFHRLLIVPAVTLAVFAVASAAAQDGYQMPPEDIVRIAEAPPTPGISVSPDKARVVLTHRESLVPLAELSRPELRIAGLRIDPRQCARAAGCSANPLKAIDAPPRRRSRPAGPTSRRPPELGAGRLPVRLHPHRG